MSTTPAAGESEQILSALGSVLRRRKPLLVLCLLGVLVPVLYFNETTLPVYEASTSVVFEELRGPVPADISADLSREQFLFNRIEEINSRAFAEDVAGALPPESLDRFPVPATRPPDFDRMRYISGLIDEGIAAFPVRNSNIVRIRVRLNDPQLCMRVASQCLIALEARTSHTRNKGVADLLEFVENQLARSATQLEESEKNLMKFKEKNGITSIEGDSREVLRKMTDAEVLLNATLADRGATEERLVAVQQAIAAERKELVATVTSIATPAIQKLKEKLVALEAQNASLGVQKYPDDHPEVVHLRQEIEQTKRALTEEAMKLANENNIGDPLARIERRVEEMVSLQIDVEGLKARADALRQVVQGYRRWLDALPTKEMELVRLERERDVNQKVYMSLLERREDIRISEAKQISGIRMIDRPMPPDAPIMPRKGLNLGLGAALGIIVGFGLGLALENRRGSLRSMLQFEQEMGWAVLALVPAVRGGPVKRGRFRQGPRRGHGVKAASRDAFVVLRDPESPAGESYMILRSRLELLGFGTRYRSVLVTSSGPRDGKSSTLSNLAAAFGAAGRPTVVVDAELRRPTMHRIFGVDRSPGLTDVLISRNGDGNDVRAGENAAPAKGTEVVTRRDPVLQETLVHGVAVLASGNQTGEAPTGFSWAAMRDLLEGLKEKYEIVLVDSAPLVLVHETLLLCRMVDAVVIIVDAQAYDPQRLMETKVLLERAGANVVGAVLNKVDPRSMYPKKYRRDRT